MVKHDSGIRDFAYYVTTGLVCDFARWTKY